MGKVKSFRPGSANFESHYLEVTPEYIMVRPAKKLFIFYSIFSIAGLGFASVPLFAEVDSGESILPIIIFGSIFFLLGTGLAAAAMLRHYPFIDLRQRIFYPLGKREDKLPGMNTALPLNSAEKIELSSRVVRGNKSSYICYTLALIYPGGQRFILLDHGALKAFKRDAELLARYTGLPLPEEAFEEEIRRNNVKAAPFLLIFGLIWITFSSFMHYQSWNSPERDLFPIAFTALFVLAGVIILATAVKLLIGRSRR